MKDYKEDINENETTVMDGQHLRLNIPNPWPKKATKEPARKSAKPPAFFRKKRPKRL